MQSDSMLPPRGNKKNRRHSVHAAEDVDGPLSPKTPMQLRIPPKRTTPIALESLGQSTTTDVRDEKSAEDDDEEDELSQYVHRRDYRRETEWKSARGRIGNY